MNKNKLQKKKTKTKTKTKTLTLKKEQNISIQQYNEQKKPEKESIYHMNLVNKVKIGKTNIQ